MHKLSLTVILSLIAVLLHAQSPHGKDFKIDCAQCHTSDSWSFNKAAVQFSHDNTHFKLIGQHQNINCKDCHSTLVFKDNRQFCVECHNDMHNNTLGKDCTRCHTPNSWLIQNIRELHLQSRFPLLGAHRQADCFDCHRSSSRLQFEPIDIECMSCHMDDFQGTTSPNHVSEGFLTNCTECHSASSANWNTTTINHDFFPLTAGHAIGCTECHVTGKYGKLSSECNSCHQENYTTSQLPSHTAAGIPNTCATCHTTTSWKPSSFKHITTGFELKEGHQNVVQCSDCHKGSLTTAQSQCIACHQVQFDTAPDHKQLGYPTDCTICHSQLNWLQSAFNHSTTNFPLTGIHITTECKLCHTSGFTGTPTECNSCHQKDFNQAQLPSHTTAGIPNTCATCHTTVAWKPSSFKHITTGFELKEGHQNVVQCSNCHKGNLNTAQTQCISCHQVQYDTAPDHKQSGYPTNCTICHSQLNWLQSAFNHSTTNFPLTGAHTSVECNLCHTSGFTGTPTECNNCHQKDFNQAQLPAHTTAGIPNTCATCHSTASWKPSSFNHIITGFELRGGHQNVVQCSDCHKGNLTSAQSPCISCHQVQYDNAPDHKQSGYPTNCTTCHTQNNWLENIFNHSTTGFQLTGAHQSVLCASCHTNGFSGTPTACYSCHSAIYNSTTNPNHQGAGLPNTCATCHSTTNWTSSTFNHTAYFPITSSRHHVACATCHTNPTNYTVFSCVTSGCHTSDHNQSQGSAGCYRCHPTGRGD